MSTVTINAGQLGTDWAYPSAAKNKALLDAHSIVFVDRYVPYSNNPKGLTIAERDQLWSWGRSIHLTWETNESAILGGAAQGTADGIRALAGAKSLGYPSECAIKAAVDTDVYAANKQLCHDYLRAFYAVIYPTYQRGLYGDEDAYQQVADVCDVWEIPNASGWSPITHGGATAPYGLNIHQGKQDLTIGWDYPDTCIRPFATWSGVVAPVPPKPPIPPTPVLSAAVLAAASQGDTLSYVVASTDTTDTSRYIWNAYTKHHIADADEFNQLKFLGYIPANSDLNNPSILFSPAKLASYPTV